MRVQAKEDLYDTSHTFRRAGSKFDYYGPPDPLLVPIKEDEPLIVAAQAKPRVLPDGIRLPKGMPVPPPAGSRQKPRPAAASVTLPTVQPENSEVPDDS